MEMEAMQMTRAGAICRSFGIAVCVGMVLSMSSPRCSRVESMPGDEGGKNAGTCDDYYRLATSSTSRGLFLPMERGTARFTTCAQLQCRAPPSVRSEILVKAMFYQTKPSVFCCWLTFDGVFHAFDLQCVPRVRLANIDLPSGKLREPLPLCYGFFESPWRLQK